MTKQIQFVVQYEPYAAPLLTQEQADLLFTKEQQESGEIRGELQTVGPWQVARSYRALCTANLWPETNSITSHGPLHVYGFRTLSNVRQSGYELEGRVSVNGKSYRGFTSSQLFTLPNGKLINVATIHVCGILENSLVPA